MEPQMALPASLWKYIINNRSIKNVTYTRLVLSTSKKQRDVLKASYGDDTLVAPYGTALTGNRFDEIIAFIPEGFTEMEDEWLKEHIETRLAPNGTYKIIS